MKLEILPLFLKQHESPQEKEDINCTSRYIFIHMLIIPLNLI